MVLGTIEQGCLAFKALATVCSHPPLHFNVGTVGWQPKGIPTFSEHELRLDPFVTHGTDGSPEFPPPSRSSEVRQYFFVSEAASLFLCDYLLWPDYPPRFYFSA